MAALISKKRNRVNRERGDFTMSVLIIGGNERMERQYKDICRDYGCQAKVFTKPAADLRRKIGSPDLVVLFTATVSHDMVACAAGEAKRQNAIVARSHSSSARALKELLRLHCSAGQREKQALA